MNFKKLRADVKFAGETLISKIWKPGSLKASCGKGKGKYSSRRPEFYAASFSLDKVSLDKIQKYWQPGEREVTGDLFLTGDITASGRNTDDLIKTAEGKLKLRRTKASEKVSVLSKLFSLLNVAQLARFQLPDYGSRRNAL